MRRSILTIAVLAALSASGCEEPTDYSGLDLVDVTGKVTMDGQPLPGVTVRFEGPPNRFADGKTDAEGQYRLMYDSTKPGCMAGEKVVRIMAGSVGEGSDEGSPVEGADGRVVPPVQNIPSPYNSASKLTASVSATSNTFDFDLKSTGQ